jgi:hypothetical protein
MEASELRNRVAGMMTRLLADVERLVGIPSVAGYPPEPVEQMAGETPRLFEEAGFARTTAGSMAGVPPTTRVASVDAAPAFRCATDGDGHAAVRLALEDAYGKPPGEAGSGGSIPLLQTLQRAAPNAEFILWGPEDVAAARIHGSDERGDRA